MQNAVCPRQKASASGAPPRAARAPPGGNLVTLTLPSRSQDARAAESDERASAVTTVQKWPKSGRGAGREPAGSPPLVAAGAAAAAGAATAAAAAVAPPSPPPAPPPPPPPATPPPPLLPRPLSGASFFAAKSSGAPLQSGLAGLAAASSASAAVAGPQTTSPNLSAAMACGESGPAKHAAETFFAAAQRATGSHSLPFSEAMKQPKTTKRPQI